MWLKLNFVYFFPCWKRRREKNYRALCLAKSLRFAQSKVSIEEHVKDHEQGCLWEATCCLTDLWPSLNITSMFPESTFLTRYNSSKWSTCIQWKFCQWKCGQRISGLQDANSHLYTSFLFQCGFPGLYSPKRYRYSWNVYESYYPRKESYPLVRIIFNKLVTRTVKSYCIQPLKV